MPAKPSPEERRRQAAHAAAELRASIRRVFSSADGARVLAHMATTCNVHVPVYLQGLTALDMAFRDGRRSVVLELQAVLESPQDADIDPPTTHKA